MDSYIVYALTAQGIFRGKSSLSFFFFPKDERNKVQEIHATSFGLYGIGADKKLYIAEIGGKSLWSWEHVDTIQGGISSGDTVQKGNVLYLQRGRQVTRYAVTSEGLSEKSTMTVDKGRFFISPSESKYALLYRQRATVFSRSKTSSGNKTREAEASGNKTQETAVAIDFNSKDELRVATLPRTLQLFLSPNDEEYRILTGVCKR